MSPQTLLGRGVRWRTLSTTLALAWLVPACLVDLDDRCGSHQHYDSQQALCVCDAEYALQGGACVACPEHEVGSPDGCVCEPGYARPEPEAACELSGGLGAECAEDADCGDQRYPHCQLPSEGSSGAGYCTNADCSSSADCQGDYSCNDRQTPSFCERPPTGLGQACSSSDDCAGNEASYCETVSAKSCVVNDCAPDPSRCYGDWVCCDIGLLSQSLCIPPSELSDGQCPAGGTIVPREEP
jgi:hypothetical protein